MRIVCLFLSIGIVLLSSCNLTFAKERITKKTTVTKKVVYKVFHWGPSFLNGASRLTTELNEIVRAPGATATISVFVKSMKSGEVLYTRNIHSPMTPASTLKVLTAEAALIYLGPQYRFATQLLTDAKDVKKGVLQGNLYIALSGDPTLTYNDLVNLLLALKSHHVSAISGNVYIDQTAYDQRVYGPGWDVKDKQYCYAAPISASIINRNCLAFKIEPAKLVGKSAQVVTYPKYFYPTIKNSVVTKNNRIKNCALHLTTTPDKVINVGGCMPKGPYAWGVSYVITDVNEYNRSLFKNLLIRLGVRVQGTVGFNTAPKRLSLISQHASEPLTTMINEMLKKSDNVIAGALFKKIGQLYSKKPGSWENGGLAVSQILAKHTGMKPAGLRAIDGSGISPQNVMSSAQMMQVLDYAFHHTATSAEFITALPVAGVDGTLKHRMGNIARKVRAKTGTISGVVSLAGYAISADNEPLAFVIIVNGPKGLSWQYRGMEDQIVTALTRYKR
ncbi:MAG: D-alanyl-D-alanine carboxypeptidase/D-alanyl-D-alanine-endopeptidase [Gammaproteobacteria bacterium]|nr:D-alanyl-D-alanine carboxypeptidase/D-alanyl-D-alanine-endopeptidase [Gammaproteobacteria bacterium]